jgi:uncharacterized protein YigE (DUF2233 family)
MRRRVPFLLIFALSACGRSDGASPDQHSWCRVQFFEGSRFTVCDNQGGTFELFAAGPKEAPLRSFDAVAQRVDPAKVAFAMNAGMFDENGRPIGLAVAAKQPHTRSISATVPAIST